MIIQLTGLSGCGKTTLSTQVCGLLAQQNIKVEVLDGDQYRRTLCKDLGFSKADRMENIRRLGNLAGSMSDQFEVIIIAAINPYEEMRSLLKSAYGAKTVWLNCPLPTLIDRDTKGLYKRALLPDNHPDKLYHFTGVNDVFETPADFDLMLDTDKETIDVSAGKLYQFILEGL